LTSILDLHNTESIQLRKTAPNVLAPDRLLERMRNRLRFPGMKKNDFLGKPKKRIVVKNRFHTWGISRDLPVKLVQVETVDRMSR